MYLSLPLSPNPCKLLKKRKKKKSLFATVVYPYDETLYSNKNEGTLNLTNRSQTQMNTLCVSHFYKAQQQTKLI